MNHKKQKKIKKILQKTKIDNKEEKQDIRKITEVKPQNIIKINEIKIEE